jgi:hypothetical protein
VIFVFPVYPLVLLVFIDRYFGGMFLKRLKGPGAGTPRTWGSEDEGE